MTTLTREPGLAEDLDVEEPQSDVLEPDSPSTAEAIAAEPERLVRVPLVVASGALATLSCAWMVSRLFNQAALALGIGVAGIVIGAGLMYLATRSDRTSFLLFAVLPVAFVVGAILATTAEGAGLSLPTLVLEAVQGGGLLQPPIPLDPGWRFIILVLCAVISAASCMLAISLARPKLAAGLPLLLALGAAVLQPKGTELVASGVAIVFLVAALALAYGADLAAEGVTGGSFEVRRLLRGSALLTGVMVVLVVAAQSDFLFPETDKNEVIPPQRPPSPPPEPDRVLFSIESNNPGPWPVGVLDVYDDNALLLPPVDPRRMRPVPDDGQISAKRGETFEATFHIDRIKGQALIGAPNQIRVSGVGHDLEYDPRTQVVRLVKTSVPRELVYKVEAPVLPTAKALAEAPAPDPTLLKTFTAMPPAPVAVQQLLGQADQAAKNTFERLQFVRNALYSKVVAAGGGRPVDVPPAKVEAMLAGGEATPYEISAAEVMLARWAGIPARLGFGFYGGELVGAKREFRPRHGAAWLETYFEGHGWVPVVGTPPKAKASLSDEQKKEDPQVRPSEELALTIYLPVKRQNLRLLYEIVRYYASYVVPIVLGLLLLVLAYPALVKALRTRRRLRWAGDRGLPQRIAVAYAELRDRCHDLNIGDLHQSPLEFLAAVEEDREHRELAWLVTRGLWGDLTRDLRVEDAEAAQDMARSVTRRIYREQSGLNRLLAWTSRASLRDPWTDDIPNFWFRSRPRRTRRPLAERVRRLLARALTLPRRPRRLAGATAVLFLLALVLVGCGKDATTSAPARYPNPLMPPAVEGYRIQRQVDIEHECESRGDILLISGCRMYTIRDQEDALQCSIQVALFKPEFDTAAYNVQRGVEADLGSRTAFRTHRYGTLRVRSLEAAEQHFYLWFPPDTNAMELFNCRKAFSDAERVVRATIRHQRSAPPGAPEAPEAEPIPTTTTVARKGT